MSDTEAYTSEEVRAILTKYAEKCEGYSKDDTPHIGFAGGTLFYQWLGDKRFRKYRDVGGGSEELGTVDLETDEVDGVRWIIPPWFWEWREKYAPGFDPTIKVEDETVLKPIERAAYRGLRVINGMLMPPWELMTIAELRASLE